MGGKYLSVNDFLIRVVSRYVLHFRPTLVSAWNQQDTYVRLLHLCSYVYSCLKTSLTSLFVLSFSFPWSGLPSNPSSRI